jgi:hypothetical protein
MKCFVNVFLIHLICSEFNSDVSLLMWGAGWGAVICLWMKVRCWNPHILLCYSQSFPVYPIICFTYLGALLQDALICTIGIYSCWSDPLILYNDLLCLFCSFLPNFYFFWYKYSYSCTILVSIWVKYLFSIPSLSSMFVFTKKFAHLFCQLINCGIQFVYIQYYY